MPGKSVSGASVALMAAGGVVIWSGLNNTPLLETLRALAKGQAPTPHRNPAFQPLSGTSASDASAAGGGGGGDIVAEARKWIGTKYVYGGCHGCTQCKPGQGVDCSSFVTWVMKAVGCYKGKCSMVAGSSMLAWASTKVPEDMVQAGDIVLWVGQHCGIVSDPKKKLMIAAPSTGLKVREQTYNFSIAHRTKVYLRPPCTAKASGTTTQISSSNANSTTGSN